jgi:hypothetical protein
MVGQYLLSEGNILKFHRNAGIIFELHKQRRKLQKIYHITQAKLYRTSEIQYLKKAKVLEKKVSKLTARIAALRDRKDYKAVAVFVTFETDTTADAIIDEFKGILPRKGTLLRNYHRLKVSRAPEPDVILWEKLHYRGLGRSIRSALVSCVSGVLLAVSLCIIMFTTGEKFHYYIKTKVDVN